MTSGLFCKSKYLNYRLIKSINVKIVKPFYLFHQI